MKSRVKRKKAKKSAFRFLVFGIIVCGGILTIICITVSKLWIGIYSKYKEKNELNEKLSELKEKEEQLTIDVAKMQDPEYVARYLREKFYYSKNGEYIIRIPE